MKNIKLYESFENYYTKINNQEYNKLCNTLERDYFNKNDSPVIDNMFFQQQSPSSTQFWHIDRNLRWYKSYYNSKFYIYIGLSSFIDEWYLVKSYVDKYDIEEYYKCDQFEGLIKCLKDIL